jgi:hypothetical protein
MVWFGAVASASAAIEIVGKSQATFAWSSAAGAVAGYYVYVSLDGAPAGFHSTVTDANRQIIHASFGDTIQISTAAFDEQGNTGPRSDLSEEVRFVESTAPPLLTTTTPLPASTPTPTPSPVSTPKPTPSPMPTTATPPADETPAAEDPLPLPKPGPAAAYDFDGDGYSDILFRNTNTGELKLWQMHGSRIAAETHLPTMAPRWLAAGVGDFDFDGITDILWYDPDHRTGRIWLMGDFAGDGEFDLQLAAGWTIERVADFDGDGRDEIAIWNQSTRVEIWGLEEVLVRFGRVSIQKHRQVVGVGDIDGDGDDDIIIEDSRNRRIEASLMSADFSAQRVFLDTKGTTRWLVIDSADYDGNGQSDLLGRDLSRNGGGSAGVWHVTSSLDLSGDPLDLGLGPDHSVLGSADYDGNGSADLLVFNPSTRELALWLMGGSGVLRFESLGTLTAGWLPAGFNSRDAAATR